MFIKQISIKNFRSIIESKFIANKLNIIVGNNDVGKSNFLRALNLFFNDETGLGEKFDFDRDFSKYAVIRKKKAPEIAIEITFTPPMTFKDTRDIVWRKTWRREGRYIDEKFYSKQEVLSGRQKVGFWLEQLKFRYVPAIKGAAYFSTHLLSALHNVLAKTIESELRVASQAFIGKIREHTTSISRDLSNILGFNSNLQIPDNLKSLFEILDFETLKGNQEISLRHRGDGIKVRHIPVILKFISEQENLNKSKGAPKTNTIWGYEEPENNLELLKAFENAKEFINYSKEIQIFITTHSPAFYSLGREGEQEISTYYVRPGENNPNSSEIKSIDPNKTNELDEGMGLLPFVAPHFQEKIGEIKHLKSIIAKQKKSVDKLNKHTLFVEGPTDKRILNKAIELFKPELLKKINIETSEMNGGGYNWVKDMLIAWHYSRKKFKAIGLFDFDNDSINAIGIIDSNIGNKKRNVKWIKLYDFKPDHLKEIFINEIKIPFAIEEMFPLNIWKHAKKNYWLTEKENILEYNKKYKNLNLGFIDYCKKEKKIDENVLVYFNTVKVSKKDDFSKFVVNRPHPEIITIFESFRPLINAISEYIN